MKKSLNIRKASVAGIILNILLIAAVAVAAAYSSAYGNLVSGRSLNNLDIFFLFVIAVVFLNSLITIRDRLMLRRADIRYQSLESAMSQVEKLNNTLRAQRHDFLNHLQVVYSLIEMEDFKEARDYIEKIYADIQKVSRFLKTSNPAVNALIQAKTLACGKHGITVSLKVASRLENMKIPGWELCRIIGNLIDNSVFALCEVSGGGVSEGKRILIEITEDIASYYFIIANNGPAIGSDIIGRIFEPGFTTKGAHGEGMGLSIVKETAGRYGGNIEVFSEHQRTSFTVTIPK